MNKIMFEVNDKVIISRPGFVYTTYEEWFDEIDCSDNMREFLKTNYVYNISPSTCNEEDTIYTIVFIGIHGNEADIICAIKDKSQRIFLVSADGIIKVNQTKNVVLISDNNIYKTTENKKIKEYGYENIIKNYTMDVDSNNLFKLLRILYDKELKKEIFIIGQRDINYEYKILAVNEENLAFPNSKSKKEEII